LKGRKYTSALEKSEAGGVPARVAPQRAPKRIFGKGDGAALLLLNRK